MPAPGNVLLVLLLVAVLLVSGVAKLREPTSTRSAFHQLRVPFGLARGPAPTLLPWAELVLALGLVLAPGRWFAGPLYVTVLLLAAYVGLVARAVRWPEPVVCGCFGRLGLGEVTTATVWRNVLLLLAAVVLVGDARHGGLVARLRTLGPEDWRWLGTAVLVTAAVALVVRPSRAAVPPVAAAPMVEEYVRAPFPFGALRDRESGSTLSLADLVRERAALLVFVDPGCGSCVTAGERAAAFATAHPQVSVHVVLRPDLEPGVTLYAGLPVLDDPDIALQRTFGVRSPGAVLLGADLLLAGGPVQGLTDVTEFLDDVAAELAEAGQPRPVSSQASSDPSASSSASQESSTG